MKGHTMKEVDTRYNGWTNWDTWAAYLWLSNDEITYTRIRNVIKTNELKDAESMAVYGKHCINGLGNKDGITFKRVNWSEVLKAFQD